MPAGWKFGRVSSVAVDSKGEVYAFHRGPKADPIVVFDHDGKYLRSWGKGMFGNPHGMRVDKAGFVWVTDNGDHQVMKFTRDGKLLLTLGIKGKAATDDKTFNRPTDIAFAPTGENEPSGDEKFFSLARQARCIPLVATQSISSLRSTLSGESWRTLLQGLRTKIFLTLSDDFSAQMAAELCGKIERLKPSYTLTEAGQDARVSLLTGRPTAHKTTVGATKAYRLQREYVFEPNVFTELQNAQAIVLAYDGLNPQPPTYCYLKPYYLDVQTSYFEHAAAGAL
jgi:hypothetical protein